MQQDDSPASMSGRSTPSRRHMKTLSLQLNSPVTARPMSPSTSSPVLSKSVNDGSPIPRRDLRLNLSQRGSLSGSNDRPQTPDKEPHAWTSPTGVTSPTGSLDYTSSPLAGLSGRTSPSNTFTPTRSRNRGSISYRPGVNPIPELSAAAVALPAPEVITSPTASSSASIESSSSPSISSSRTYAKTERERANSPVSDSKRSLPSARSAATLIEQHGDLLSFIAKKERKCLDLREELKRHEDELRIYKRKWETIIAREQQATIPRPATPDRLSASTPSPRTRITHSSRHSISSSSPITSLPTDQQPAADLAKKWMGGIMKSGLAGFNGMLEGMSSPQSPGTEALGTLQEEAEEESDQDTTASKRTSNASNASTSATSIDEQPDSTDMAPSLSTSSFASSQSTASPRTPMAAEEWVNSIRDTTPVQSPSIADDKQDAQIVALRIQQAEEERKKAELLKKHGRRRSTFDMLGGWSGAWEKALSSETLQSSKKAAMATFENIEKTIQGAIVLPNNPAHSPEVANNLPMFPDNDYIKERASPKVPSKPNASWDWSMEEVDLHDSQPVMSPTKPATAQDRIIRARAQHKRTSLPSVPVEDKADEADDWGAW